MRRERGMSCKRLVTVPVSPCISSVCIDGQEVPVLLTETRTFYVEYYQSLAPGPHHIVVNVCDLAGNAAQPPEWSFTCLADSTPPSICNLSPADTSFVSVAAPTISANIWDAESGVDWPTLYVSVDSIQVTPVLTGDGFTYTPPVGLTQGVHTVYVNVFDKASNLAESQWTFTYVYDTLPIMVSYLEPPDGAIVYNNPRPGISAYIWDEEAGCSIVSVTATLNGNPIVPTFLSGFSYTPSADLAPGVYTITVFVQDDATPTFHSAAVQWSFTCVTQDTTPPVISYLSPEQGSSTWDSDIPAVCAGYSDDLSGVDPNSVMFYIDGIPVTNSYVDDTWAVGSSNVLPAGRHSITLSVADMAGNVTTQTNYFSVFATPKEPFVEISPNYGPLPVTWGINVYARPYSGSVLEDVTRQCQIQWTGGPVSGSGASYTIPAGAPRMAYTISATATYHGVTGASSAFEIVLTGPEGQGADNVDPKDPPEPPDRPVAISLVNMKVLLDEKPPHAPEDKPNGVGVVFDVEFTFWQESSQTFTFWEQVEAWGTGCFEGEQGVKQEEPLEVTADPGTGKSIACHDICGYPTAFLDSILSGEGQSKEWQDSVTSSLQLVTYSTTPGSGMTWTVKYSGGRYLTILARGKVSDIYEPFYDHFTLTINRELRGVEIYGFPAAKAAWGKGTSVEISCDWDYANNKWKYTQKK